MKLFCLKVMCEYKAQFELRLRFPLPFLDWRAHSMLLFQYNTGRRIEWEVWRWISTPGTDESMAALSQTRAAMLWSVKQKYDPSKSLRFNHDHRKASHCTLHRDRHWDQEQWVYVLCYVLYTLKKDRDGTGANQFPCSLSQSLCSLYE